MATDVFGVSGRQMIKKIIRGNADREALSELAKGRLKNKKEDLKKSFDCKITEYHRMLIKMSLKHIEYIKKQITELGNEIDKLTNNNNLKEAVELLDIIP